MILLNLEYLMLLLRCDPPYFCIKCVLLEHCLKFFYHWYIFLFDINFNNNDDVNYSLNWISKIE